MPESQAPLPVTAPDAYGRVDALIHARLADAHMGLSPIALGLAQADWWLHLATSPGRQMQLAHKAMELGQQAWVRTWATAAESAPQQDPDPRFVDEAWSQWPFRAWREGFMATDAWWREAAQVDGMTQHHAHMVGFFARQGVDALSPSNWPLSNPTVLKAAIDSGGQSWLQGAKQWLDDVAVQQKAQSSQAASELKPLPYQVGKDVAVTPGTVIYRNRLIEVLQYTPSTDQVHPEPLLIVPSCIMKYYILDLSPENSMVRYLVSQGFTVCIISWHNPDASDRDLGLQDYLRLGVMEAMAAVQRSTGARRIHSLGYCLGGTFLAMAAAVLGRRSQRVGASPHRRASDVVPGSDMPELASVVLLAAQTDFSEPGELGVFIDADQLKTLNAQMDRTGYLSGKAMAGSFQFLNSRDLVWSRNTRRYLLGQDEVGNDMMSWNADVTRLPARMHSEYLSSLFLNNALAAGHYRVDGQGVALMDIKAPMFVVGTVRDHVSPWRSVYKIHLNTDTQVTFVLVAGGHNAGIISEPGRPRRSYQVACVEADHGWVDPESWMRQTPVVDGSWWPALSDWLRQRSGPLTEPPPLNTEMVLGDAPGLNVMVRYAD